MTRAYGFRIYVVQAFHNVKRGRDPEDVAAGGTAQRRILELLDELTAHGTYFLPPRTQDPGMPARPTVTITVGPATMVREDLYHLLVASGEEGSHRSATRSGSEALDLVGWSPEAGHFVTLLFPQGAGDSFLVIVETIRRRDPLRRLLAQLTALDLEAKKRAQAAEEAARTKAADEGTPAPARQVHTRLLFEARQAADNSYIDQILASAKTAAAVFTASVPSDRGRDALHVQRKLSVHLLDEKDREVARTAGRRWFRRQREGQPTSVSTGVSELGDLLEEQELLSDGEAAAYDAASITVKSETSETTTIAVDTMRDVFTYPVSDGAPTVQFYYDKVGPRAKIVAAEESIEVVSIDTAEVVQCLEGSTPAP